MTDEPVLDRTDADREKRLVALSSIAAAVLLTGLKLGVGLWTNSLGILSEAAHSGLDLVAAGVTFWAVRYSGRPADDNHPYGHGKFENLSALFETGLLLVTCVWIVYEGCRRLFGAEAIEVDASVWAFAIVILSIVVDVSRSRALYRVARKYHSQALEADALHFSTDIWSSCVVLVGLGGVLAAESFNLPWLLKADAAAALGVAGIVIVISMQLGRRAFDDLSDAVATDLRDRVLDAAATTAGVERVTQARLRRSGPDYFVDLTVSVGRAAGFEQVHDISEGIEASIRRILPTADVVVHLEPVATAAEDLTATIQVLAARFGIGAHSIRVYQEHGQRAVELHAEVDRSLNLADAHDKVSQFEQSLRQTVPDVRRIVTHIEPAGAGAALATELADEENVRTAVDEFMHCCLDAAGTHRIEIRTVDGQLGVSLHVRLPAETAITVAHDVSGRFEQFLRRKVPKLRRVVIHVEPEKR